MEQALELMSFKTTHLPRPHVNALVRPHLLFTPRERCKAAMRAGWNVFEFPSKMLMGGDLLSDSGTTTLTVEQFAALVKADEAYGNNWGYGQLLKTLSRTTNIPNRARHTFLFHQCRRAEDVLYSHFQGRGVVVPSNSFFDTTRANAEANGVTALDLPDASEPHFGGNIDLAKLEQVLAEKKDSVPFVLITVTNNTGGGQPASLANIKAARDLARKNGISLFLDACRFAENAWFIQKYEKGNESKCVKDIVHEMFALCDGYTISFKKDGLANMGGALVLNRSAPLLELEPNFIAALRREQIRTEGHHSYGGLSGRDIMTIVEGLPYVVTNQYLDARIAQVHEFGAYMKSLGIPILEPFGGHAVYLDVDRFFAGTKMRREDFGGISLCAHLLLKGVRLCELGAFAFGRYDPKTNVETLPKRNYVRAAVPRNKYEELDLKYVAECIQGLYERRESLPPMTPVSDRAELLRNFTSRFMFGRSS